MSNDTYDQQIEALLNNDRAQFEELTGIELPNMYSFHYEAWNESSSPHSGSLFATVKEMGYLCVTQMKRDVMGGPEPIMNALADPNIPTDVATEFTREQLEAIRDAQRSIRSYFNG